MAIDRIETTNGDFINQNKREISKAVRNVPKYSRSSAAAKVASAVLDRTIDLNRMQTPACSMGCAFCCHLQTDVSAGEAFVLAAAVRAMPADRRDDVLTRLRANADTFIGMSLTERQRAKIPCALLDLEKQACSVYNDRPTACRRWHSLDSRFCEIEFYEPATTGTPADPIAMQIASLAIIGYREAIKEPSGELHQGVLMAIDPDAEKRFARGEPVFQGWLLSDAAATEDEISDMRSEFAKTAEVVRNLMSPTNRAGT